MHDVMTWRHMTSKQHEEFTIYNFTKRSIAKVVNKF